MYYPVRLRFEKRGVAQYISHLDLNRSFARAFSRAKLPVMYTEGFNPHYYTVFGPPIPVGYTSSCEVIDIRVDDVSPDEVLRLMNEVLPPCLYIYEASTAVESLNAIAYARYELILRDNSGKIKESLGSQELFATKTDKKGREKQVDVLRGAFINNTENISGDLLKLDIDLPAQLGGEFTSPELFVRAVESNSGLKSVLFEGKRNLFLRIDRSIF